MKTVCFYHGSDLDGKCSGAIVAKARPQVELIPINYDQPIDMMKCEGNEVIFVDFCPKVEEAVTISQICSRLIIIDHHKTVDVAKLKELCTTRLELHVEIGQAGCELTWNYFFPDKFVPEAVRFLGRYDVWDHSDPRTLPFQYGARMKLKNPSNQQSVGEWPALLAATELGGEFVEEILEVGEICMKYQQEQDALYTQSAFEAKFNGGLRALCLNKMYCSSQVFASRWDNTKYDVMIAFGFRGDKWTVSLYTDRPDVDCGELCKRRGGGGHRQAAGFAVNSFQDIGLEDIRKIEEKPRA